MQQFLQRRIDRKRWIFRKRTDMLAHGGQNVTLCRYNVICVSILDCSDEKKYLHLLIFSLSRKILVIKILDYLPMECEQH